MPGAAAQSIDTPPPGKQPGQFKHLLPVHTTVPGRARFKVNALYRAEKLKDRIEARLLELNGIRVAKINILTASLVIHFDPATSHADVAATIDREFAGLSLPRQAPSRPQEQQGGFTNVLARAWEAFKGANNHDHSGPQKPARTEENPPATTNDPWHALECKDVLARVEGNETGSIQRRCRPAPGPLWA